MNTPSHNNELRVINDENRPYVIEWLKDRYNFHIWFSSLITGSFIIITIFGLKPNFSTISGSFLSTALIFLLFSLLCNLVSVWSIPTWKYRISTAILLNAKYMRLELAITSWLGVTCFLAGLTFGFIGNLSQ